MIVLGLTGSIGMGKSATAQLFAEEGVPVNDADAVVHELYAPGGAAVDPVGRAFPGVIRDGAVDRALLSERIAGNPAALARLEAIVHPLVARRREAFLAEARREGAKVVVLDVPLLFEAGQDRAVDAVVVVSCTPEIQRERVLARPGMSARKLDEILKRQLPDDEKRARADFVVDTSRGLDHAREQVRRILRAVGDPSYRPRRKLAAPPEPSH
jgi:dephospho-CoA kinase